MHLRRFPSFGLRDPAFLQGAGGCVAPIATNDANTQSWYNASLSTLTFGSRLIGDLMDTTVDKTSLAAPNYNLLANVSLSRSFVWPRQADNRANMILSSENVTTSWTDASGVTLNTATTFTFNVQNAYLRQYVFLCESGRTYTFKFKCRNISGNTAIRASHLGAASGDYTDITIDGTLTQYTVTFTGIDGLIRVGLLDPNAAGHGQVEFTEAHIYRDDHDSTYLATDAVNPLWGRRGGIPVFGGGGQGPTTHTYWGNVGANRPLNTFTMYMAYFPRWPFNGGYLSASNDPTLLRMVTGIQNSPNSYLAGYMNPAWQYGTVVVPNKAWSILTWVFNGASSELRVNKNAADAVNLSTPGPLNKLQHIGESYTGSYQHVGDCHEIIVRTVADNTATQDSIIEWMACQIGLSV